MRRVSRTTRQRGVEALTELGFTGLEAEVYAVLVEIAPVTAYRVANVLGKAAANVYKAVESLAQKGAVLVDDGASRLLRAVPPSELLARVEREQRRAREQAERALERLRRPEADDRVYRLETREQVMERAETMLRDARQLACVDAFPEPLAELRGAIDEAVGRKVRVLIQAYEPVDVPGARVVVAPRGQELRAAWPAQWLNVVCDAREHMISLLRSGGGEVVQAIWTGSAYLSVIYYSGLVAELERSALVARITEGASRARLEEEIAYWRQTSTSTSSEPLAGVAALKARLSDPT